MAADMAGDRQACFRILQSIAGRKTRTHHLAQLLLRHQHDETGEKFVRLARETDEPRPHIQALIESLTRQYQTSDDQQ